MPTRLQMERTLCPLSSPVTTALTSPGVNLDTDVLLCDFVALTRIIGPKGSIERLDEFT